MQLARMAGCKTDFFCTLLVTEWSRSQLERSCWQHLKRLPKSSVVPTFLVDRGKVGKAKIPLARPTLVKVWWDNSRRLRTHEKKIGAPVRPLGKIIQSIFLCPIGSQHSLDCLKMVWWESVTRGSNVFSRTTWLPLGLQGWRQGRLWLECVY